MRGRKTEIFLIFCILILSLSAGFLTYLLSIQEDFTKIVNKQFKNYISSPFQVNHAVISPFKKFPNISVLAENTVIYENPEVGYGPLMKIGKIYLQLNFWSFFRKEFVVEKIEIDEVEFNGRVLSDGQQNFDVFISSASSSDQFKLNLRKILVRNFKLNFLSEKTPLSLSLLIEKLQLKGLFYTAAYIMNVKLEGIINEFSKDSIKLMAFTEIKTQTDIFINTKQKLYNINSFQAWLNENELILSGQITNKQDLMFNIKLASDKIELNELIGIIPLNNKDTLKNFDFEGNFSFHSVIKGILSESSFPEVFVRFNLNNAKVKIKSQDIIFDKINVKGNFSNAGFGDGKNGTLEITNAEVWNENDKISFSMKIDNLLHPYLDLSCYSDLKPEIFPQLLNFDNISDISGKMNFTLKISGYLDSILARKLNYCRINFSSDFRELSFRYFNYNFQKIKGKAATTINNNDQIELIDLTGKIDNTYFSLIGNLLNYKSLIDTTLGHSEFKIKLKADNIDLNHYLNTVQNETEEHEEGYKKYIFPSDIRYRADIMCDRVLYEKLVAEKVSAALIWDGKEISISGVSLNMAKGKLNGNGKVFPADNNHFQFDGFVQVNKMEIKEIFREMDNFQQDYITDKHLSGLTDCSIQFSMKIDYHFIIDEPSIYCLADVVVFNGNIKNFKPLQELFGFVRMKKLNDVWFSRLENTIMISNKVITIPRMLAVNTAFNIELSGTHTFDNHIDYFFKINLTDLFFKQYKQNISDFIQKEANNIGGINIYVSMTGTVDDYHLKYEPGKVKEVFKRNEEIQKTQMKEKLKTVKKQNAREMEFFWDEE